MTLRMGGYYLRRSAGGLLPLDGPRTPHMCLAPSARKAAPGTFLCSIGGYNPTADSYEASSRLSTT